MQHHCWAMANGGRRLGRRILLCSFDSISSRFSGISMDIHGYSMASTVSTAFVKLSWSSQLCRSATMLFTPHMLIVDLAQMLETTTTPMAWSWGRSHCSCSFYWILGQFEHLWTCVLNMYILYIIIYLCGLSCKLKLMWNIGICKRVPAFEARMVLWTTSCAKNALADLAVFTFSIFLR